MELQQELESKLNLARALTIQNNLELALDTYTSILEDLADVPDTNLDKCDIYVEYSNILVKNFSDKATNSMADVMDKKAVVPQSDDDLEIAWNLIQLSLIAFRANERELEISECRQISGEILLLNNNFEEAKKEFEEALIDDLDDEDKSFIYERIGQCLEFVEDERFVEYYEKAISLTQEEENKAEIRKNIEMFKHKMEARKMMKAVEKKEEVKTEGEFVDISDRFNN